MIEYLLIAGVITATVVFVGKFLLKINLIPVLMAFTLVAFGVNPLTYHVGSEMAKDQASTFNEYWNGFETSAVKTVKECTYNGSCYHEYDCDPYPVVVMVTSTDSKGNTTSTPTTEIHYNSCPVSTQESSYFINSTVDNFTVAAHLMTGPEYRAHERRIPGGQQSDPTIWTEAKARIDSGKPGPVTAVKDYKNYILASQDTLFGNYSDRIEDLKSKSLLPTPSAGVFALYQASKAYKVGNANVPLFGDYVTDVSYLNGAVGDDLHGDLHVLFAPEDIEGGKDDYANAVLAYWQSKELKRDAVSKNSIIVVIGASKDGQKVSWAKAMTGMPIGNEHLMVQLASDLKDKPLDKDLLGRPSFDIASEQVKASNGALESILWGVNKFERVSMAANSEDDKGSGFMYLRDQMKPSGWEIFWIAFVNILIAGLVLFGSMMLIVSDVLPSRFFSWKGSPQSYKPSSDLFSYSAYGTTKKRNPYADLYDSGFLSRDGGVAGKTSSKKSSKGFMGLFSNAIKGRKKDQSRF